MNRSIKLFFSSKNPDAPAYTSCLPLSGFRDFECFFLGRNTHTSSVPYRKEAVATSEITYDGIPRGKIPWDPRIDYEKCIACGKCFDFCHVEAFRLEEEDDKRRIVVNPNRCIVFCRGCQAVCSEGAISHPSEEKTQKTIDELKEARI